MQEQFVTYEIALALKKLGFDEACFAHWQNSKQLLPQRAILKSSGQLYYSQNNINPSNQYGDELCTAPLWQQVVDWLDSEFNLLIIIVHDRKFGYQWKITTNKNKVIYVCAVTYQRLYETREQAILKTIELCKNNL